MTGRQISPILNILVLMLIAKAISNESNNNENIIGRMRGNLLKNITRTHIYENNVVTSRLDASYPIRIFYRKFRELYSRLLGGTGQRTNGNFLQESVPARIPFPCRSEGHRSRTIPVSVHQLRPGYIPGSVPKPCNSALLKDAHALVPIEASNVLEIVYKHSAPDCCVYKPSSIHWIIAMYKHLWESDIDVIAAMGDSLTAATAANSAVIWELLLENRGVSWSIGGQGTWRTHLTLPNILKEFNPNLFGYSLSDSYNVDRSAQFNVAENIAATSDMPYNAEKLVKRMRLDPRVNMQQHWKLLTFMIGGNDFCSDICYQTNATEWINDNQERNLVKTLRFLRDHMPRTLVNLVPTPLVNLLFSLDNVKTPFSCALTLPVECSCLFGPAYSKLRELYRQKERNLAKIMESVSFYPEFHTETFTVVFQPFLKEASIYLDGTQIDLNVMAVDCLHLSQKGHAVSANGLWNNMMEPVGYKSLGYKPLFKEFKCPTDSRPYIFTNFNS